MKRPYLLILVSVVLIFVGIIGYLLSERVSITALFPTLFGFIYLFISFFSINNKSRDYIIILGFILSIGGILLSYRGVQSFILAIPDLEFSLPLITWMQTIMAILCFIAGMHFVKVIFSKNK